jgi:putative ABC transport system permease protein
VSSFFQDLRFAFRNLRKTPGFVAAAVFSLAIGIGANTTIFSAIEALRSQELPYHEPDRLAVLWQTVDGARRPPTYRVAKQIAEQAEGVEAISFVLGGSGGASITDADGTRRTIPAHTIEWSALRMLGTPPVIGRVFGPEDLQDLVAQKEMRAVVISYRLWQERFGGSLDAIGKTVRIGVYDRPVIGVMPEGFRTTAAGDPQVWIANDLTKIAEAALMIPILRVKAGANPAQLNAEVERIGLNAARSFGEDVEGFGMRTQPLHEAYFGGMEQSFLLLLGAVSLVLLIACVNVATLLLARGTDRRLELTVRAALGAKRGRLVQQMLAESVLLSFAGGLAGTWLAVGGNEIVSLLTPAEFPEAVSSIAINPTVLLFTMGVSILVAPCVGLLPALRASHVNLNEAMKEGGRGSAGPARSWSRSALLVAEIGLSMVLLVGTGWMMRGYLEERYGHRGFNADSLLTATVGLDGPKYFQKTPREAGRGDVGRVSPEATQFFDRLLEEIRALPGVEQAGAISNLPSDIPGPWGVRPFTVAGHEDAKPMPAAYYNEVDGGALQAMGVPLLRGRYISAQDTREGAWVAVISRNVAERYFPGQDPVGRRIHGQVFAAAVRLTTPEEREREIVGVVGELTYPAALGPSRGAVYVPQSQHEWEYPGGTYFTHLSKRIVIRTSVENPEQLGRQIREIAASLDSDQVVDAIVTMDSRFEASPTVAGSRFAARLFGVFGALAVLLAMSGAYAVMAYFVAQREREFGIRMALGANRTDVMRHVLKRLLTPAAIGIAAGALGGVLFTKALSNQFAVRQPMADPAMLAATAVVMALVAAAAGYFPARRATRATARLTPDGG